jgi:hypothetical protein
MKTILKIAILLTLIGCNPVKDECLINLEKRLAPVKNEKIIQGEIINIKDSINCFDWDSLLIESGYGTKESIKKYYEVSIPYNYSNTNWDTQIIFFLKNKVAINHIQFERDCKKNENCKSFDFLTLIKYNKESIINKDNAVFEVYSQEIKDNQGNKWHKKNAIKLSIKKNSRFTNTRNN